jgi:hypothetical protein
LGIDFDLMLLAKNDVYHTTCTIGQQSKAGYRREPLINTKKEPEIGPGMMWQRIACLEMPLKKIQTSFPLYEF